MVDSKTSHDAKTLAFCSSIFKSEQSEHGIYFIDVNGRNVKRKHSWANIIEAKVVSIFVDFIHLNVYVYEIL